MAVALLLWPHRSYLWDPLLIATIISLGISSLFLILLSGYGLIVAVLYGIALIGLGIVLRKWWITVCATAFLMVALCAIAYYFPYYMKAISLSFIGLGAVLIALPYVMDQVFKKPEKWSPEDGLDQY
jgi:hypothetical protein